MIDAGSLRLRVLTILGAGLLATGPACGGSAESEGAGAAGQVAGAGGNANPAGGSGATAVGGTVPPAMCYPGKACFTYAELVALVGASNIGALADGGAPGAGGMGEAGVANEVGAAGLEPGFACPSANTPGLLQPYEMVPNPKLSVEGDKCCYPIQMCYSLGRPFTVEGESRTAPLSLRGDWTNALEEQTGAEPLPAAPEARASLAAAWLEDALAEHASIASFARLTLELMQHAAPSDLVMESQLASLDEVEHARLCFAQAARYGGVDRGPGMLSLDAALGPIDLPQLAANTVLEGCLGETLAALIAAEQARAASDPRARVILQEIAEDEARHAEFAWRVVRWALSSGDAATRDAVARAFEPSIAGFSQASTSKPSAHADALRAHGRLSVFERTEIMLRGLRDVVAPCARALLLAHPARAVAGFERSA